MDDVIHKVKDFHGHLCPGLTIGVRAAEIARREIGAHAVDEKVVAVVETDMCAVDAIQVLTDCTFGKGNLIHRDYGKNAFTFFRRGDGRAIRVVTRPDAWLPDSDERKALQSSIAANTATEDQHRRYWELQEDRALAVLRIPEQRLFDVQEVNAPIPGRARIHASLACEECGEQTMETRIRRFNGRQLCIPCFEHADRR